MSGFVCNSVFWKHRECNFILSNLDAFCILLLPNCSGLDFQRYTEHQYWERASLPVPVSEEVFSAFPCSALCLLQICHACPFPHHGTFYTWLLGDFFFLKGWWILSNVFFCIYWVILLFLFFSLLTRCVISYLQMWCTFTAHLTTVSDIFNVL